MCQMLGGGGRTYRAEHGICNLAKLNYARLKLKCNCIKQSNAR
jgi:hypothetical protein